MGLQIDQVIRHCTCREATLEGETDIMDVKEEVRRLEVEEGSGYVWYRARDAESWR